MELLAKLINPVNKILIVGAHPDDVEFSTFCLEKLSLAVVPGSAFGAPGYVRLSFATSMDNIKLSVEKLASV